MQPNQHVLRDSESPLHVTAVIVLYGMTPEESPAFHSLIEARVEAAASRANVSIVLWDNSPSWPSRMVLPEGVAYFHDARNLGLAFAYNQALEIAFRQGSEWLITLDQDTTIPRDYLLSMASAARHYASHPDVGAIVPQIAVGRKRLSPNRFALNAVPQWFCSGFRGIPDEPVFAMNSGAMVRMDALRQIGGYDLRFPLDYSDAVVFHLLHQHGKRVYIEGNLQLHHEFSMMDMNRLVSEGRYRRGLMTETAFWDLHMNWLAGCERTARLALRMVRHRLRGDRKELQQVTLQFLKWRLFRSKKTRLRRWQESLGSQSQNDNAAADATKPRPRVSVCMAAYSGAKFIEAQIGSILCQLAPDDEIVIVDDCSQDDTVSRILQMRDSRIRLFVHEKNEGVVATFEDALRCATGNILFLSDDDDLWAPNKVERVLQEFERHPEAQLVASRVALIDERGQALPDDRVNRYGRFLPGFWRNIIKNHYQGSAMAIRAAFLGRVLPFPRGKLFLHDAWIGTRNDAHGGKTVFINEPLVYYRRHSQNSSQRHDPLRLLKVRINLLIAHLIHAF
ncbi:MAG TPA: glycosyltransferase [Terracidiphilus sp.]|jgi:GT2 family glycosyltransferase